MNEFDSYPDKNPIHDRLKSILRERPKPEPSGYLGTFGKGFKSELTMGYGAPDEPPRLEGIGEKVAYGAGALAGMIPSFAALSAVTTPVGGAILRAGRIGKLVNTLHKMGKVYKIAEKVGKVEKVRNVSKLGMAVEGAAKSGALFAAHGAAHELPPGEEDAFARVKAGAEAVPMGLAFGAAAPLAGGRRLAQIGTAAGIGAGATAISGGTTEDILIQGGLLGAMSAMHISVKDAHSFAKQIAGEVDKLPAEQKGTKIAEILDATREDRLEFARAKAEAAPSETDLIREDRLSFARERAKDQPMGVPGDLPSPEKRRLPGRGVVLGEEPRPVPELLTAGGRPVSEAAEHERIVGALDTEGTLRGAIQAVKIRDLKRQEGLIEAPGAARRPTGPVVGVRGAFGMRARPEPLVEPIKAGRPEVEGRIEPEPEILVEPRPGVEGLEKMSLPELLSAHEKGGAFNVENKAPETTWGEPCRAKFEELTGEKWSPEVVKEVKRGFVPEVEKPAAEELAEKPKAVPEEITAEVIRSRLPEAARSLPIGKIAFKDLARASEELGIHPQTAYTVLEKGERPAGKITKLDIEPEKVEEPKAKIVPEKEPAVKAPGEGQLYKKTLAEIHKDPDVLTSQDLIELHEHRARVKGFEKAGGSFVEGYLNKLAGVAEKTDMNAATAAYNALGLYRKGELTRASLEAEKVLGSLHKAEKEALTPDKIAELHKEDIKKALSEGKLTPEKYAEFHEKDYGPLTEFMPEAAEKPKAISKKKFDKQMKEVALALGKIAGAEVDKETGMPAWKTATENLKAKKVAFKIYEEFTGDLKETIERVKSLYKPIVSGREDIKTYADELGIIKQLEKKIEELAELKKEPVWEEGQRPSDKDILNARKIVQAEKSERKKIIEETGFPQGRAYGLIEKIAETPTTKEVKAEKPKELVAEKPEAVKEEPKIVSTPEGKEVFVPMSEKKAEGLSLKKQKAYLAAEVDKAIEAAPDIPDIPRMEMPSNYEFGEYVPELTRMAAKHKAEINALLGPEKAYVTIRVPGDGEFTVVNEKGFLKRFKDQIKKFPVTAKPKGPAAFFGKPRPSTKPIGKRITGEDVEYYNEFKARKQNLIEREPHESGEPRQSYGDGFFTDGHYAVKLPEKPKTKKPISTGKKAPDIKSAIPTKGLKKAEVVGEFRGPWPDYAATIAHVIAKDGTEIFLNTKYVDLILTKYPKAKPYVVDAETGVAFKVGKETVGAVMPMKMEIPEFLKARAAEVAGVKPKGLTKPEEAVGEKAEKIEPLSETKSRLLDNIKSEKGSSELINDLSRLGADAIKRGHKNFKAFAVEMKAVLGEAWTKVKHLMQRAYAGSKKILAGEKGTWTIKGEKAKAKEPVTWTMEEVEKRYADVLKGKPKKLKTGILSTNQEKVSEDAKKFSVAIGTDYVKTRESEIEWERSANRIIKNRLELLETIKKASKGKEKLSPTEERVILKLNDGAYENFTSILKKGNLENINKKVKAFQDGLFKTEQDMGSDAGRNLRAFRRIKDVEVDAGRAFAGLEREIREQDVDMYNAAVEASKLGNYKPIASFMKYLEKTKANPELMDYVYEYWYQCILSGVPTHVVNVASNTAWAAWQIGVHQPLLAAIDPIVAKFQKRPTEYYFDEIVPMLAGIRKGFKPGAEAAKEIMTKGYTTDATMDKWALDMGKTIGAFARSPNKYLRQIAPFLTIPTKALRAMDVWANQMNYQAKLGGICKRMEKQGKGKFKDLMQNPTEEMQKEAAHYGGYTTFMDEPGKLTKWLEGGRDIVPGGRFVMPFVRTIANLTKRGAEMTPGLGIVLGRKATGPEVTQVVVKQIEGAMIALVLASMVADDRITGDVPADKAEREAFYRQGKLPWAIKIGGRWRQFRRLEPFNGPIAAVAIAHDAWKKTGEVPSTDLAFRCTMGIVDNILDSSYLSGLTQVLDSVRRADTAPQKIANMFDRTIASFSPMSSFQRSFVRAFEAMEGEGAIVRKPKGVAETIKAITPGISKEVAAKKNIWGKEVVIPGSPLEQWLPWKAARPTKDVVELEIERLHGKVGLPYPGMPAKYMTVRGERVDLTDEQYDQLLVEGGQAAKKRLDRLVGTGYWKTMSDKEKTARIKRVLADSRKAARNKLKRELGKAIVVPGARPRHKPRGFVPAAFTGKSFKSVGFGTAGF